MSSKFNFILFYFFSEVLLFMCKFLVIDICVLSNLSFGFVEGNVWEYGD